MVHFIEADSASPDGIRRSADGINIVEISVKDALARSMNADRHVFESAQKDAQRFFGLQN